MPLQSAHPSGSEDLSPGPRGENTSPSSPTPARDEAIDSGLPPAGSREVPMRGVESQSHSSASISQASSISAPSAPPIPPTHAHGSAAEYVSQLREQLNGHTAKLKVQASEHAQEKLVELRARAKELAHRWNALSGYEDIEKLKLAVSKLENDLHELRSTLQSKREAYVSAVSERSASQRQLSDLLGRKPSWTEQDLATYTSLLHSEHSQSRQEKQAESAYNDAEKAVQEAFDELMRAITQRYHEEHIWSDRMRLVSTWGSVAIAVLNAFIFIMALLVVEPYKRRKLANTLESRLLEGEQLNAERMAIVIESFEKQIRDLRISIETLDGDLHESYPPPAEPPVVIADEAEHLDPAILTAREDDEETILMASPPSRIQRIRSGARRTVSQSWDQHGELVVAGVVGAAVALLGIAVGQMGA